MDQLAAIEARRAELLRRHPTWEPTTLDAHLDACAAAYGERPFVIADDVTMTYADVAARTRELAAGLASLGVRPGDHVGLLCANHPDFVPAKFAIARAGAVAVPFNYLYRRDELAYVLGQSRCSVLLTMTGYLDLDYPAMLDGIAPGWPAGEAPALPDLRHVVLIPTTPAERPGVRTLEDLAALGRATPGPVAAGHGRRPDDVADMLYTSGTTGSPKGVLVTHDAVLRTAWASALTRAYEDGRRILFSLPCYHMFGYVEGLLSAMVVGGSVVLQPTFSAAGYLAGIERHRATDILAVPTMSVALLEHPDLATRDLSSLRAMLSGAAPAPVWLWERLRRELGVTEMVTGYGMTECGGAMTLTRPEDPLGRHADTVGRPKLAGAAGVPGGDLVRYKAVDPLTLDDVAEGEEGELVSQGPTTMLGYWDEPEKTAEVLGGGWLRSGDLGRVRPDGYLQVTGRSKELYKSGGELVMPKEIEELLTGHPGIHQAFAVGVPDERWGEIGVVWVVPAPGAAPTEEDVLRLCREKLARFKVPRAVLFCAADELPTTPTGKVQKFRLVGLARDRLSSAR